jgi:hypothetical protein
MTELLIAKDEAKSKYLLKNMNKTNICFPIIRFKRALPSLIPGTNGLD